MFTCGEGGLGVPCSPAPVTGSGRSHVQPLSVAATSTITFLFYHTYAENQKYRGPNFERGMVERAHMFRLWWTDTVLSPDSDTR